MEKELLKKIKTEKLLASTKYLLIYGRQENLTTYFSDYTKEKTIEKCQEGCIISFPKKGVFEIIKNYRGTILAAIAAKFYYVLFLNRILQEDRESFRKYYKFSFEDIAPQPHRF